MVAAHHPLHPPPKEASKVFVVSWRVFSYCWPPGGNEVVVRKGARTIEGSFELFVPMWIDLLSARIAFQAPPLPLHERNASKHVIHGFLVVTQSLLLSLVKPVTCSVHGVTVTDTLERLLVKRCQPRTGWSSSEPKWRERTKNLLETLNVFRGLHIVHHGQQHPAHRIAERDAMVVTAAVDAYLLLEIRLQPIHVFDRVGSSVLTVANTNFVNVAEFSKDKGSSVLKMHAVRKTVHDLMAELKGFHQRLRRG